MMRKNRKYLNSESKQSWNTYIMAALLLHLFLGSMLLIGIILPSEQPPPATIYAVLVPSLQSMHVKKETAKEITEPKLTDSTSLPVTEKQEKVVEPKAEKIIATPSIKQTDLKPIKAKPPIEKKLPKVLTKEKLNTSEKSLPDSLPKEKVKIPLEPVKIEQEVISSPSLSLNQDEINRYRVMIAKAISRYWVVPANLDKNLTTVILLRLAPGGVILEAKIIQSSGEPLLDRSALAAVNKASPLPVPENGVLFDQFRELRVKARPEGIIYEA